MAESVGSVSTVDSLDEFEQDLHQHIHLENNILHPKGIVLENKLL